MCPRPLIYIEQNFHNQQILALFFCVIMSSVIARKWLLKKSYEGTPKREDLEIIEEELPPLKDGGQAVAIFIY